MAGGYNFKLIALLAAVEAAYKDDTVDDLDGQHVIPIGRNATGTYKPMVDDDLEEVAGGWAGSAGHYVGATAELSVPVPLRPVTISEAMTERPIEHPILSAVGYTLETVDSSVVTGKDAGKADGATSIFNVTINGGQSVLDGSVTLVATVGGVQETISWDAAGVRTGGTGGTVDHDAGTISGAAFSAVPDAGTHLLVGYTKVEEVIERIGTGDDTTTPTVTSLTRKKINRSSLTISADTASGTDDGAGNLDQGDLAAGATIAYDTGVISGDLTWDAAVASGQAITATYKAKVRGPYVLRYVLRPYGHSSAALQFLVRHSSGGKKMVLALKGARGLAPIVATRRKQVMLNATLTGILHALEEESGFPDVTRLPTRHKVAAYKAESEIVAHDVRKEGEDTGVDATAAGGAGPYTGTLPKIPKAGTVRFEVGGEVFVDVTGDSGSLSGSQGGTGTINYSTGQWSLTLGSGVLADQDIKADYHYDQTHTGVLLDVTSADGAFSVTVEEDAQGDEGVAEIALDPATPSSELTTRLDLDAWDVVDFVKSQSAISSKVTWRDPASRANSIRIRQTQRIANEGVTISPANARGEVTLSGPHVWGLPDEEGPGAGQHMTDPSQDIFVLEYVTDPSQAA